MSAVASFVFHHHDHREKHRWSGCFAAVIGAHVLAAAFVIAWASKIPSSDPMPPAVMIDLAPVPAAAPPAPPPPVPKTKPRPPEPKQPKVQIKDDLPTIPSEVALPATPPAPVPTVETAASPAPAPIASAASKASFESVLLAHLERHKRYPQEARMRRQQGVAFLRFTMDRGGHVLGYKLHRSSGFSTLDDEVLALIVRAQPLPPIPAERTESQLDLVVPVQYFIK